LKSAAIKKELDALKNKDLPEAQQHKQRADMLEQELAKYKAKELAETVADDLKIPKAEQAKYLKYVTAIDESESRINSSNSKKTSGSILPELAATQRRPGKGILMMRSMISSEVKRVGNFFMTDYDNAESRTNVTL